MSSNSESDDELGLVDTSHLLDADWAEINALRDAYKAGGQRALSKRMATLSEDPARHLRIIAAFDPQMVSNAVRDAMAEIGMTEEELREIVRKGESPAGNQ